MASSKPRGCVARARIALPIPAARVDIVFFGNHDYHDNDNDDGTKPKQIPVRIRRDSQNPTNKPVTRNPNPKTLTLTLTPNPNPSMVFFPWDLDLGLRQASLEEFEHVINLVIALFSSQTRCKAN